ALELADDSHASPPLLFRVAPRRARLVEPSRNGIRSIIEAKSVVSTRESVVISAGAVRSDVELILGVDAKYAVVAGQVTRHRDRRGGGAHSLSPGVGNGALVASGARAASTTLETACHQHEQYHRYP